MTILENQRFDQERALYGSDGILVRHCCFDGPADGESALKESRNVTVEDSAFHLRYPFWHDHDLRIRDCELTEACRAALWYSEQVQIENSRLHGPKALRECRNVSITGCDIVSSEFGWSTEGLQMRDCTAVSEYFLLRARDIAFVNVDFQGKYSFQYIENATFDHCRFDTKDAFWHAKQVVVRDSVIRGEYLSWYSEGLTLIRCKLIGTQPLCYCKDLRLIDCEMIDTDLCFEKSEVEATVTTPVLSIKNPRAGTIRVPSVGEIILDDPLAKGQIEQTTVQTDPHCA